MNGTRMAKAGAFQDAAGYPSRFSEVPVPEQIVLMNGGK
jgi:hypothetical protein